MRPYCFSDEQLIDTKATKSPNKTSRYLLDKGIGLQVDRSIVSRIDTEIFKDGVRNTTQMHNRQTTWYRNSHKVQTLL